MTKLYQHDQYPTLKASFLNCKWSHFKDVHMKVAQGKCPICECMLDESVVRPTQKNTLVTVKATIDHYRPQQYYGFLKCDDENYLLMCSECNSNYKKSKFPLYPNSATRATNKSEISNEKPLVANPIIDNIYELFELVFISKNGKQILELHPKESLETTSYEYQKALETVKLFGLYDCDNNIHPVPTVHNCRIDILATHFGKFYELAKARSKGEVDFLKKLDEMPHEKGYGFIHFIYKGQFKIAT